MKVRALKLQDERYGDQGADQIQDGREYGDFGGERALAAMDRVGGECAATAPVDRCMAVASRQGNEAMTRADIDGGLRGRTLGVDPQRLVWGMAT